MEEVKVKTATVYWESIGEDDYGIGNSLNGETYRLKVPGGWLVKSVMFGMGSRASISPSVSLVFVSDPTHQWEA